MLENYLLPDAYLLTLYFQTQFMKVHYTVNTSSVIKCSLKKEQCSAKWQWDLNAKKRKYQYDPEKKKEAVKKRYANK